MNAPIFTESELHGALAELDFTQLVAFIEKLTEGIQVFAKRDNTDQEWIDAQASKLSEETGEFTKAYNRFRGWSRTPGGVEDVYEELSDVVISAFAMFAIMDEDAQPHIMRKLRKVIMRGYINPVG